MIKYRKIRGHNRILKDIDNWKKYNLKLDIDYLESNQREYCKIWVSPFANISVTGSEIPSPKGKHRKEIIKGLLEIYNHWEQQLKELNKPYYLAIWLFEPRLEKSQVVCAIDDMINFYDTTFYKPEKEKNIPIKNYGKLQNQMKEFNWQYALDEDTFFQTDVDAPKEEYFSINDYLDIQKWYNRKIKQGVRTVAVNQDTMYAIKKGVVWIGTKN